MQLPPVTFSRRTAWDRQPNPLAQALDARRRAGAPVVELTESNPTRCGFAYPAAELLSALSEPALLRYEPEPLGLRGAREAICAAVGSPALSPEQLLLTASTSEAYGFAFKLLCDPADNALAPRPSYPLFDLLSAAESVELRPYALCFDGGWRLDLDALTAGCDARTRAVLCVNPGNPTGAFLKRGEGQRLAELCAARGWGLVVDEVFNGYGAGEDPDRLTSVLELELPCLTFVLGGLSKLAGLPQLKLSWMAVAGPKALREEALARLELLSDCYLSVGAAVQRAAGRLLALGSGVRAQIAARLARNRRALSAACGADSSWSLLPSEGGWSAVLRLREQPGEVQVCLLALQEGCLVHPGHFFDFPRGEHLVLSLLPPPETFDAGLAALRRALARAG